MPKKSAEVLATLPPELSSGEKLKKKKKKRKKSEGQEGEEESAHNTTLTSMTSVTSSSPGHMSPSKKKKKKKRRKSLEDDLPPLIAVNGHREEEEEEEVTKEAEEGKKKKKKKRKHTETTTEEEEKQVVTEEQVKKKKKKKEKRNEEEEGVINSKKKEEEEKKEEERSPKKKKKKKKAAKEEEEEEEKKVELQATSSTKGKKPKKTKEEEEEETGEHETAEWTMDETLDLLERVTQQFPPPEKDKNSCGVSVRRVDWGAATPPGRSPGAAQEHFMGVYKKIKHSKSITTVLGEMRGLVESGLRDRRNRPLLPKYRFLKKYLTPELKDAVKRKGESIIHVGNKAWKNLPEEEKQRYVQSYAKDCSRVPCVEIPMRPPKLPYQVYRDDIDEQTGPGNSRTRYAALPAAEQLPYIRRALEDHLRYQQELAAHTAANPDFSPPPCPAFTQTDLKTYLESRGWPKAPPTRPQDAYRDKLIQRGELGDLLALQKSTEAYRRYKTLSPAVKLKFKESHAKTLESHKEQLQQWTAEQDPVTLLALKKYQELTPAPNKKPIKEKQMKERAKHLKIEDVFPHTAPAVLTTCPKFLGEPPRPAPSAFKLFSLKLRATYENLSGATLRRAQLDGWKGLGAEEVKAYESRCCLLHGQYERDIKAYVQALDTKNRQMFLGFHRFALYKFFGNRDIFAEDFPNSEEYPVFIKGVRPRVTGPRKPRGEEEEESGEEEDVVKVEVEEEEEEEPASKGKGTGKLSPLLFLHKSPPASPPKGRSAQPPLRRPMVAIPSVSSSEEEEEEEEEKKKRKKKKKSDSPKKSQKKSTTAKTKPPPPPSESESEEEVEITPAWHTPQVPQPKKKSSPAKKTHPPPPQSESDSEEEDVTPAWKSPQVPQTKKQQKDSDSSSGFSD